MTEKQKRSNGIATPVNILWENVLMIPLFGTIDSVRAQEIMETMLSKIIDTGAKTIILDILGVATVDTGVANHLMKISKGCRLLGSEMIISGISAEIAQTLIGLGTDLGEIKTTATLKDALEFALERAGLEITERKK